MNDLRCAALDWDKTSKDYVECDRTSPAKMTRIEGLVTVQVTLCDTHRYQFEEELARFDGCLSRKNRVKVLKGESL